MRSTFSLKPKIYLPVTHSPATEVRKIAKQIPNSASDFIVIRPTAMTVLTDFGLVVRGPPSFLFTSSVVPTLFSDPLPHVIT